MSVYKAIVSYDGRPYQGFQKQPNKLTIQGTIEEKLSALVGAKTLVHGAGRTDSGVSARGQVVSFSLPSPIQDVERFRYALNRLLPSSIYCSSLEEMPFSFDARHSAAGKIYSYSFCYKGRNPLNAFESPLAVGSFDFDLFEKAMMIYDGFHDFRNFTTKKEDKDDFKRDVHVLDVLDKEGHVFVRLSSNGFMTYMVRILVGSAIKVATKKFTLEYLSSFLDSEDRKILSFKSDPRGLILEEVLYGE